MDKKMLWGAIAILSVMALVFATLFVAMPRVVEKEIVIEKEVPVEVEKIVQVEKEVLVDNPELLDELERLEQEKKDLQEQLAQEEAAAEEEVLSLANSEVIDDLLLSSIVSFNIDDGEIARLQDGEVKFDDEYYDVKERLLLSGTDAYITYSAIGDEELGSEARLAMDDKRILSYRYEFDEDLTMSEITEEEELTIEFLGQELTIIGLSDDEMIVRDGVEYFFREGETKTIDGREVLLAFVGENGKVSVCVDGVCETLEEYDTEEIDGVDVLAKEILVNSREGTAVLVFSTDAVRTIDSGDDWVEGSDDWVFLIESTGDYVDALVVAYDQKHDDYNDEYPLFAPGEELCFPGGLYCLRLDAELNAEREEVSLKFDDFDDKLWDDTVIDKKAVLIETSEEDAVSILDEDVDSFYLSFDGMVYYQDSEDDWYEALESDVLISHDDYDLTVYIGVAGRVNFVTSEGETIRIDTQWADEALGLEKDEAESEDVRFNVGSTWFDLGTKEYDFMGPSGIVVESPEDNADNDEVVLKLPSDVVEYEVLVYATA